MGCSVDEQLVEYRASRAVRDRRFTSARARAQRRACRELEDIARSFATGVPDAIAAQARGAVDLAEGDAKAALGSLRRAFEVWQRIEAPYVGGGRVGASLHKAQQR